MSVAIQSFDTFILIHRIVVEFTNGLTPRHARSWTTYLVYLPGRPTWPT